MNLRTLMPKPLRRVMHYGSRFHCPFCKSNLRQLLAFGFDFEVLRENQVIGGGLRDNCLCPVCGSTDRERLLLLYLANKTPLFTKPTKLLHIAPEPLLRKHIARHPNVEYITGDLNRRDVTAKVDIMNIQFPDDSFDAVICNHVLEHVPDDRRAMTEFLRVLRPGGWAILQVPISYVLTDTYEDPSIITEAERERVFGQYDHVRIYAKDYLDRLREAGFTLELFDWTANGGAFGAPSNRFALIKEEKVFALRKAANRTTAQSLPAAKSDPLVSAK